MVVRLGCLQHHHGVIRQVDAEVSHPAMCITPETRILKWLQNRDQISCSAFRIGPVLSVMLCHDRHIRAVATRAQSLSMSMSSAAACGACLLPGCHGFWAQRQNSFLFGTLTEPFDPKP
jgi:hypothetical protein